MISDAYVMITCDTCGDQEERMLPVMYYGLSGRDPHVDLHDEALEKLLPKGWVMAGDVVTCKECRNAKENTD